MRVLGGAEATCLADHILKKALRALASEGGSSGSSDEAREDRESFEAWLRYRFREPLERDAVAGPRFGRAATLIGVGTIAAGLASSTIANVSNSPSALWLGVLGLVVGVLGAVNQIWRPGERSVARYQAAFALRREGWNYLRDRGRYVKPSPVDQLALFIDEVNRTHRAVESVDEATTSVGTTG
jgi:hypothetical protein